MPNWSNVSNLTREELADFCKSLRQIKFFENLADNSNLTPSIIEDVQIAADAAFALANVAVELARRANKDEVTFQKPAVREHLPALLQPIRQQDCCVSDITQRPSPTNLGFGIYLDSAHTTGSPLTILDGTTATVTNNASTSINKYMPHGWASFYDSATNKIVLQRVGNYNICTIRFDARCSAINTNIDIGIDVGGSGYIAKDVRVFPKGAGVDHSFTFVCPLYADANFVTNGGMVKVTAQGGDVELFNIEFEVTRTYTA